MNKKVKIIIGVLSVVVVISMSMIGFTIYNNLKDKEDNKVPVEENNNQNNYQEEEKNEEPQYVKGTIKNNKVIIDEENSLFDDSIEYIVVIDNFKINNKNYKLQIGRDFIKIGENYPHHYVGTYSYDRLGNEFMDNAIPRAIYTYNDYILFKIQFTDSHYYLVKYILFSEDEGIMYDFMIGDRYFEADISNFSSGKLIFYGMTVDEENDKKIYKRTTHIDLTEDFNMTTKTEKEGILCEDLIKEDDYPSYCAGAMGLPTP